MLAMKRHLLGALTALALGAYGGLALGGCGSQTKTVTIAAAPTVTQTTATSTQPTTATTTSTSTGTTPAQTGTAGGTAAPSTTRTESEPAFTQHENHAEGLGEAEAVLSARGYTANETSQYHPNQTLRVLVGTKGASSAGYDQLAFFFVDGHYVGTDTKVPSAGVTVLSQSDTEVTLSYPLYRTSDSLSSPSGRATVRFQLDNGKLTPLDPIPPASSTSGLSRY